MTFSDGGDRHGEERAGDAGEQRAGRDGEHDAERVHLHGGAHDERLQHVALDLLHEQHDAEHDQRDATRPL